jgi:hypothetical protein
MTMKPIIFTLMLMVSLGAAARSEAHKLYSSATLDVNPVCDVHLSVNLVPMAGGVLAELANGLDGVCEIFVDPNPRSYRLSYKGQSCGSVIYEDAESGVQLIDHRNRRCFDLMPVIELKEGPHTFYSLFKKNRRPGDNR